MTLATVPPSTPATRAAKEAREALRFAQQAKRTTTALARLETLAQLRDSYAEKFGQCQDASRCEQARNLYAVAAVFEKQSAGSPTGIGWAVDAMRLALHMLGRTSA
ncbi:hypothetical protein [Paraburkholderia sediminicola]|uniref:hypothetical protein n=1 Tax=Paraburkholderia sediminicola TaxID=458836 RepID=UPI0038B8EA65